MGFKADIMIWDFATRTVMHKFHLHKVEVASLAFSHNEQYLASLGGQDDQNMIVWDVESGKAVCGSIATIETAFMVKFFNNSDDKLITVNNLGVRIWSCD